MAIKQSFLDELEKRRAAAKIGGGEDKLAARRKKGIMTARDRLAELFQAGTFQEWGLHADHDCKNFGLEDKVYLTDGVVTGTGLVDGRVIASFSQDFTVCGGSLGRIHAKKICDVMDYALKVGCPIIGFNDSGGARIQEGDDSLSGYGQVFSATSWSPAWCRRSPSSPAPAPGARPTHRP
jgi:propionyl-CoA carboxylase beta chain